MKFHSELAGLFKLEAVKLDADGNEISRRTVADWFPNLITNGGLERMGDNAGWLSYCQVGTSSTTPAVTDSALGAWLAGTSTQQAASSVQQSGSPYYGSRFKTFRFAEGVAAGNLTEVGVGWANSGSLFSHALILDGGGNSITVTILSNETLDVTYEFRYYPKETDSTGTGLVFTGNIGGTYDWIMRPAYVATAAAWSTYWSNGPSMGNTSNSAYPYYAYNGDIGALTAGPSGTPGAFTPAAVAYVASSLERKFTLTFSLTQSNLSGGIRSIRQCMGFGVYQFQFAPAIPKTAVDTLVLTVSHSWSRKV